MFRRKAAANPTSPSVSSSSATFASPGRHHEPSPSNASRVEGRAPASPLPINFDFELESPSNPAFTDSRRPNYDAAHTLDTVEWFPEAGRRIVSLAPPVLPPIPRVASRYEKNTRTRSTESLRQRARGQPVQGRDDELETSYSSQTRPRSSFERSLDFRSFSQPVGLPDVEAREAREPFARAPTFGDIAVPKRDSSPVAARPTSSGFFDDKARPDASYQLSSDIWPPARQNIQATQSTPDLLSTLQGLPNPAVRRENRSTSFQHSPLSNLPRSSTADWHGSQNASLSPQLLQAPARSSQHSRNASHSPQSSRSQEVSPSQVSTVGTPYDNTSPAYPLPRTTSALPKMTGTSTLGGITVPTHHSTATLQRAEPVKTEKSEKRKTRLLSPFTLLAKRRAGQEDEALSKERAAQEQALARQKDIAAVGVSKLPENFDPRIKGKKVHDFSAPRPTRRNPSHSDGDSSAPVASSSTAPFLPALKDHDPLSLSIAPPTSETPRRTSHAPVFVEHLAENPDHARRLSSLQAERLENKDFLQRASYVSSISALSQDSYHLPPFARRSQHLENAPLGISSDEESKRLSDQSSGKDRSSGTSSFSSGQNAARYSIPQPVELAAHNVPTSISPSSSAKSHQQPSDTSRRMSPQDMTRRRSTMDTMASLSSSEPVSASDNAHQRESSAPQDQLRKSYVSDMGVADNQTVHRQQEAPLSLEPQPPKAVSPLPEQRLADLQQRESTYAQEALVPPTLNTASESTLSSPSFASSGGPPIIGTAEEVAAPIRTQPTAPPRLIEKSPPPSIHPKRGSRRGIKHHVSNASRFSFQFGGSAAEEHLEDKHRRKAASGDHAAAGKRPVSTADDEDEDDYFDEDAMDDMDEMEFEAGADAGEEDFPGDDLPDEEELPIASPSTFISLSQARSQLQSDSDSESDYSQHEGRMSKTKQLPRSRGGPAQYSEMGSKTTAFMQPQAMSNKHASSSSQPAPAAASQRDSGNSQRQRAESSFSFEMNEAAAAHKSGLSGSSMASVTGQKGEAVRPFSQSTVGARSSSSEPRTASGGIGLGLSSGLADLSFADTPASSRPPSSSQVDQFARGAVDHKRTRTVESDTLPFGQGAHWQARVPQPTAVPRPRPDQARQSKQYSMRDDDDMYFDDGRFDPDVNSNNLGEAMDESKFDDDSFLARKPAASSNSRPVSRPVSAMSAAPMSSMASAPILGGGGGGPYPTFAMPNAQRAKQRDSQMLLEDIFAYDSGPVDPKLLPQRNPSEDAKRLGLSDKVPPLPAAPGNVSAMQQISASLNAYHAALADAATKAAAEGRFSHLPSSSTTRSISHSSRVPEQKPAEVFKDDASTYSADGGEPDLADQLNSGTSGHTLESYLHHSMNYSPQKMSFDFGFDGSPTAAVANALPMDELTGGVVEDMDDIDDDFDDPDMIAAANSEALASDDEGFYGQEFGFYAKARMNSNGELEATNGGFFGEDGDDGLTRNKSLKEPNLTPITERSEFSTRNSFIGLGFGPPSSTGAAHGRRLSVSPLFEGEVTSFEELRRLRANAFGGSSASLHSDSARGSPRSSTSVTAFPSGAHLASSSSSFFPTNPSAIGAGGEAMSCNYSNGSSGSSNPPTGGSAPMHFYNTSGSHQQYPSQPRFMEASSPPLSSSPPVDMDATPRRPIPAGGQHALSLSSLQQQPSVPPPPPPPSSSNSTLGARRVSGGGVAVPRIQTFASATSPTNIGFTGAGASGSGSGIDSGIGYGGYSRSATGGASTNVGVSSHSRKSSGGGADSVTYVQEQQENGPPRWVMERRRTSELGQLELVGREVVQGGWI